MTPSTSFSPSLREKILFAIPFAGVIPSLRFDAAITAEIHQARSTNLLKKAIHLLIVRNDILDTGAMRDLFTSALLLTLVASDRIKNPHLRLISNFLSLYFAYSGLQKDGLIEINRREIIQLSERRPPSPHF